MHSLAASLCEPRNDPNEKQQASCQDDSHQENCDDQNHLTDEDITGGQLVIPLSVGSHGLHVCTFVCTERHA